MEMMTVSSEWLSIHEKLFKKYQITKLSKIVYDVLVNSQFLILLLEILVFISCLYLKSDLVWLILNKNVRKGRC